MNHSLKRQLGIALIVTLLMLFLISMLTVASVRMTQANLQITSNIQSREQVNAVALSLIQEALSTPRVVQSPDAIILNPCGAQPNSRCVDLNGDGITDVNVVLTPTPSCFLAKTIPNRSLDLTIDADKGCALGVQQNLGVVGAQSGNSLCADSVWEVTAVASDVVTAATATYIEGVAIRVALDDLDAGCPAPPPP